ncbi:hypothetical protein OX283_001400 [Flavobacterium sp. SUN052]|uniref:hypothetical protein n=1 Tax=Flavobacterium sp. SUN052 TaxID=3002441 RepID=UPI00237E8430|nr:hypothetical protein [Flavobacterium sp. SUN052]MEC4003297.1 hypothetical protein [Flavobacterium sp. SUN052]
MDGLKSFTQLFDGYYIEKTEFKKAEFEFDGFKIIFDYNINDSTESGTCQKFTRITTAFIASNDYKFQVYENNLISFFVKIFGIRTAEHFNLSVVKTIHEFEIKSLVNEKYLQKIIKGKKNMKFYISNQKGIWGQNLPKNEFELSFYSEKIIEDIAELKSLLDLFKETITHLVENHSIQPKTITF